MLPKTPTAVDDMLCTTLASHAYALSIPWGLTCPLLGCNPSTLTNTSNDGDT